MKKTRYTVSPNEWRKELERLEAQLREGILTDVVVDGRNLTITIIA